MHDTIKYYYGFGSAQELLEKATRDRDAVLSALESQDDNAIKDSIFNFVVTGYHIKDWLKDENENLKEAIEVLLKENKYLAICRALANGSKHKILAYTKSINQAQKNIKEIEARDFTWDSTFFTFDSTIPINGYSVVIETPNGDVISIQELMLEVIKAWQEYIEQNLSKHDYKVYKSFSLAKV